MLTTDDPNRSHVHRIRVYHKNTKFGAPSSPSPLSPLTSKCVMSSIKIMIRQSDPFKIMATMRSIYINEVEVLADDGSGAISEDSITGAGEAFLGIRGRRNEKDSAGAEVEIKNEPQHCKRAVEGTSDDMEMAAYGKETWGWWQQLLVLAVAFSS
ncbi:hypothetical protein ACLOJK_024491 [Asimina triloba]